MAKPMEDTPGNSMHIHQSILKKGKPIFVDKNLKTTKQFDNYMGGLQKYSKAFLPLFAPNVNSFKGSEVIGRKARHLTLTGVLKTVPVVLESQILTLLTRQN